MLNDENIPNKDIINKIRHDSIFSVDLRKKLGSITMHTPLSKSSKINELINNYFFKIAFYFLQKSTIKSSRAGNFLNSGMQINYEDTYSNILRFHAIILINRKSNDKSREEFIHAFMHIIQNLQNYYKDVSDAFHSLRAEILK